MPKASTSARLSLPFLDAHPSLILIQYLLFPVWAAASLGGCLFYRETPFAGTYVWIGAIAFLLSLQVFGPASLYPESRRFPLLRTLAELSLSWLAILGILWTIMKVAGMDYLAIDPALQTWAVATPFLLVIAQWAARSVFLVAAKVGKSTGQAVIIGMNDLGLRLADQIHRDPFISMRLLGFFDEREGERLPGREGETLLGKPHDLPDFLKTHNVRLVYIALPMARQERILDLLDKLRDSTASIYFVPDLFITDLIQARFDRVGSLPVVAVCDSPFRGLRGVVKRASDIVFSCLILALILPVLFLVAVGVKLSSPGPVLFKQRRYGLDGEEIQVYKFRSMTVCEDGGEIKQARQGDARITPFGRFIRKTSLDELPQFFNVLRGEMSIVGPRPHAVAHNELYRRLIDGYMVRHKVRPGITGWAQVNGLRGETDTVEKMAERIRYDLDYLRNWSLAMDIGIVFRTVVVVLGDRNAY